MIAKLGISFGAGLLGFLSPCCLPLLPGYVGYMTGGAAGERVPVRRALPGTLAFVGGLSVVFVSLGATASVLSGLLWEHRRAIEIFAGMFIVALGGVMVAGQRVPLLMREKRFDVRPGPGAARTFALGAAFAFGWTPCVGPTLGAALNLAATGEGLREGVPLLLAYSMGLGMPFALAGLGLLSVGRRLRQHAMTIQMAGGVVLMFVGILVLTGRLTAITIAAQRLFTKLGIDLWNKL